MASSWGRFMEAQMGWPPMDEGWRKGPWTSHEDRLLIDYVKQHGEGRWNSVSRLTELRRNGKSCRLRWVNYLRPDLKRGQITPLEEKIILDLHARWGNRWSTIARSLPGRTDNEIKNYWRTHFKRRTKSPIDSTEKLRARLLRRQQFQQQQQQLLLHSQQSQQQEEEEERYKFNQLDMKKIISLLEDDVDNLVSNNSTAQTTTPTVYWSSLGGGDEKGLFCSTHASDTSASEGSSDQPPHHHQDTLWGVEDVQSDFLQHLVSPFYRSTFLA